MAKVIMEQGKLYDIQPIKGENYHDCNFLFGEYQPTEIDGQYFQVFGDATWWDSEGFTITELHIYTSLSNKSIRS